METAPLKSFATWARTSLIREVTARIAVVLAPASPERVEKPKAVDGLERAVRAAGGGDKGKAAVADRVAYIWFNRIIALRFMDANGYTGIGVVSPQAGVDAGQPEILAEAKRGNIDAAAVGGKTRETVTGLLNGARRSDDPQGEAYALLLADYCRHWNRAMPFMFEREGDFTELLIPADLMAEESVPSRAVKVLTKDVCQDVEVIGWLYQFYISERKDEVFAGFKKNKKAGADEIPAATQLFTPDWIVRYLVENSVGRLWMLNRPASRLVDQMQYYIAPVDGETNFLKIAGPEDLKVIDPACGSGHMLTYAFDLLYAIYEEEGYAPAEIPGLILTNNLYGVEIDPRAGALAAFALTMKARATQRTFFNKQVKPNVCVLDPIRFTPAEIDFLLTRDGDKHAEAAFWNQFENADTFGSLIQPDPDLAVRLNHRVAQLNDGSDLVSAEILDRAWRVLKYAEFLCNRYSVIVANPPYMGSKNMNTTLVEFAKSEYPDAKADMMTMFMRRAFELTLPNGYWAMIDLPSWMFLTTFVDFRNWLLSESWIQSLVHLGRGVFGSDFGSVAFVCKRSRTDIERIGVYRRLFEEHVDVRPNEQIRQLFLNATYKRFEVTQESFRKLPGEPIAYWLSAAMRAPFSKGRPLREIAEPRKGMDTGDNARFLRGWWEVSRCASSLTEFRSGSWVPYNKGGGFRRWYGYREFLVDWRSGGSEMRTRSGARYFGREGWTWGTVTSGGLSMRFTPPGAAFDNGGCTLFSENELFVPALILNSTTADAILAAISPTVNFQPINIGAIPILAPDELVSVAPSAVRELIAVSRSDWDSFETSWDFAAPPWLDGVEPSTTINDVRLADRVAEWSDRWSQISQNQQERETKNNRLVAAAYDLVDEVPVDVSRHRVSLTRNVEFRYGRGKSAEAYADLERADVAAELVSYAVGCMFGRYSLDVPGLILADQGATVQDYLSKVSSPRFTPDDDNVIPIVDGDWFEDDIVARFRTFLRAAFGEKHFEENLRFVSESLGIADIREYFIRTGPRATASKFYDDHVQRYKKRPIYWLFSSAKGSFNALIYMHRYTPSTVSTVLNEYLREFRAKLSSSLQHQEQLAAGGANPRQQAAALKEADRLRKVLLELEEYEHDVLYPLASRQLVIDLDDGVKANYPKFGAALKKIVGLEASDE